MANRKKALSSLGLSANASQQITSSSSLLQQNPLAEESGLVCAICLEGYRSSPQKVLAIYTFTKKRAVEEHEAGPHKTVGYSTVSHFNIVHVECHLKAVKFSRGRDEWDCAALHNANTLANGLLPLWGPHVQENAFATCLARHNSYLQECTGHRDITYTWTLHDLKLLLLRYANEASFSGESGGGGPQSNMSFLPYLLHMALYVINSTKVAAREVRRTEAFAAPASAARIRQSAAEAEGAHFFCVLALAVVAPQGWRVMRRALLRRLLCVAQLRGGEWPALKSACLFWSLVDRLYSDMFAAVSCPEPSGWSWALQEYIRRHDAQLTEASLRLLQHYQGTLLPCASFQQWADASNLQEDDPASFLADALKELA